MTADADRLAAELGDLPLAVAQAAGFMAETGTSAAQYLELLRTQAGQVLDQAAPGLSYPRSLAAATRLAAAGSMPRTRPPPSWLACARSWPPSRSRKTCSPAPPAHCPASWPPGPLIRWAGGRPWPG